jgi:sigma-B regulation protein RsbU (phosphoserine phosphatase)
MAKTTSLLRCLAKSAPDAGALLHQVNNEICETSTMGMFVTIIAGYLDPQRREVEIANGGHQPALVRRSAGVYDEIAAQAPPLGVLADIDFPMRNLSLDGDAIYLYTDGMSESIGPDGEQLDTEGLKQMIEFSSSTAAAERLAKIVEVWRSAGHQSHDDITLMLVELAE